MGPRTMNLGWWRGVVWLEQRADPWCESKVYNYPKDEEEPKESPQSDQQMSEVWVVTVRGRWTTRRWLSFRAPACNLRHERLRQMIEIKPIKSKICLCCLKRSHW